MTTELPTHFPAEALERRAAEQRERIHESVTDLKASLQESVREHLDPQRFARLHLWKLAAGVSAFAFVTGYAITGMFTRH